MQRLREIFFSIPDIRRGEQAGLEVEFLEQLRRCEDVSLPVRRLIEGKKNRIVNRALFGDLPPLVLYEKEGINRARL